MLGLLVSLLTSKLGRAALAAAGIAIAVVALYGAGEMRGRSVTNAKWERKGLENQIKTLSLDLKMQREIAELAKQSEAALTAKAEQLEQQIQDYATYAQTLPPAAPGVNGRIATDDDLRRLRNIGGNVDRRPDRPANPFRLRKYR